MKLLFTTFLVLLCTVLSKEWYISQIRGNDNNSGTRTNPLLTFQKAHASLTDGDSVNVEIGVYNVGNFEVTKSFKIKGIRESGQTPLFSGPMNFKSNDISITGVNFETKSSSAISSINADTIKISDVTFSPVSSDGITIVNAKSKVELSDIVFSNTRGLSINSLSKPTGSVVLNRINIRNAHQGVLVKNVDNLRIKDVTLTSVKNCRTDVHCGLQIEQIKDFDIDRTTISDSERGFSISNSKGILENSKATNIKSKNAGITAYGGGLYVSNGSELRTKNVDLIGNDVTNGGGFYCGRATLNMVGGKIHNNKAVSGGAGQCDSNGCAFFIVGADIKNNTDRSPSVCRGIPNLLKKLK